MAGRGRSRALRRAIAGWATIAGVLAAATPAAAALPVPIPHALPAADRSGTDTHVQVQQALDAMVKAGAPGALARVDDTTGSWTLTSGTADLTTRRDIPHDARFRIASLTKGVVATTILRLAETGRLELDRPVATWLPGAIHDADRITVRRLLNHTSGLADYLDHPSFRDPQSYTRRTWQPQQLVALADGLPRAHPPGERFTYANAGYILLGLLIEKVTGNRLGDEIEHRVLRPAGMTRTRLPLTDPHLHGPHATGYLLPEGADATDPGALEPFTKINPSFAWAAYGLVSDARDVNRFYQALFSGRLIGPASLEQMRTAVDTRQAPVFPHYGLGLATAGLTCGEKWGGTGSIPGYVTFAFADRDGKRRMTISVNVQRNDPKAGEMLIHGVDALNRYFCGTPYPAGPVAGSMPAPAPVPHGRRTP